MNKKDTIFAVICGLSVAWIGTDFLNKGAPFGSWILFIILPMLSVVGLWLVELIGKKMIFVHQAGKFALSGTFADVIDIKVFQFLFWLAPFSLFFKGVSFLAAMAIKYAANKFWAFEKHGSEGIKKELAWFSAVTLIGLAIDVVSFYYFTRMAIAIPKKQWVELCIIFAAVMAAVWNFIGYKFIVFRK